MTWTAYEETSYEMLMHGSITAGIKAEFAFFPCMIAKQLAKILPLSEETTLPKHLLSSWADLKDILQASVSEIVSNVP